MKVLGVIGGILGILTSLFCILFAIVDDSYTFGNIGFLGVLGGILSVIVSFKIRKSSGILHIVSAVLGFIGLSILYILPGTLQIICGIAIINKTKQR